MPLPKRKTLPHTPPDFVSSGATFFITLCGEPRGTNQLALPERWPLIQSAANHYHGSLRWHVRLLPAMPDHVHLLAGFPGDEDLKKAVSSWKRFLANAHGFSWQRDFFDHRLRCHESLDEKASYVRMNPVRAGLIARPENWPYVWTPSDVIAEPSR